MQEMLHGGTSYQFFFFWPVYRTCFETKLAENSTNKITGEKTQSEERTAWNKGRNQSLPFSEEMQISSYITRTFWTPFLWMLVGTQLISPVY